MSFEVRIPDDLADAIEKVAQSSGKAADELVLAALRAHFPPLTPELRSEFDAWDAASEDDARNLKLDESA